MPPRTLVAALIALAACSWGCGAGGCGGEPSRTAPADARPTIGKGAGGSGEADLRSRFDTASQGADSNKASQQAREAAAPAKKLPGPQTLFDVDPAGFSRVLQAEKPALVIVYGPDCRDCDVAMPALRALSRELRAKFEFYRIDGSAVGASGVLPAGLLEPLPAFAIYEKGQVVSTRTALPFARETARKGRPEEPLADYQQRLYRWFSDALAQRNLKFGSS